MKTPYDNLAKTYAKIFGHMTKMAAMPIYLVIWYVAYGVWAYQFCSNKDPRLILTGLLNLLPYAFGVPTLKRLLHKLV